MLAVDHGFVGVALDFDGVRVGELRGALKNLHAVALQLRANHFGLARDDGAHAEGKILHRNVVLAAIVVAVESLHGVAGQLEDGFADAFAGNGAGVHADAANHQRAINHGDALAELRGANSALLPRRAAADHDQVKIGLRHSLTNNYYRTNLKLESRTASRTRLSDRRIGCTCRAMIKGPASIARREPKCVPE